MTKAAYFDLDGTLVGTSLIQPTAYYLLNQASPLKTLQRFGRAFRRSYGSSEMQDRRTFNEILFSHFRGMTEDRIEVFLEVFEDIIRPAIFSGAHDLFANVKRRIQSRYRHRLEDVTTHLSPNTLGQIISSQIVWSSKMDTPLVKCYIRWSLT